MTFTITGRQCKKALESCQAEIERLDKLFSVTDSDSEISRINASSGEYIAVCEDTLEIIRDALVTAKTSDYLFDITIQPIVDAWGFYTKEYLVPSQEKIDSLLEYVDAKEIDIKGDKIKVGKGQKVDLGGIAKGYLSDRIYDILMGYDIKSAVVSLGGSILVVGHKDDGSLWRIGLEDPFKESMYIGILETSDISVVTSGDYERYFYENGIKYHHIFDPTTGYPVDNSLVSVTIVMLSGTKAEVFSTALFVMGEERAIEYWRKYGEFEMILINEARQVIITPNLKEMFSLTSTEDYELIILT